MATIRYRPVVDGLRAVAVLAVFVFHLNGNWLPGGFIGVDLFFVISGFLITSIIYHECNDQGFSLSQFYQRRISRIFPVFCVAGLITLAAAWFIYSPQDLASTGATLASASLSIANLKFMTQGDYFHLSADAQPLLHYWSLSVEEQFYLCFPLFFLLLFKYARTHLLSIIGIFCLLSFLMCVAVTEWRPVWAFYLLPTRAWQLLAGSMLAVLTEGAAPVGKGAWRAALPVLGLILIGVSFLLIRDGPHFPGGWALLPVLGTLGILLPSSDGSVLSERWLATAPMVLLGRMSYSLYIWHWPVFCMVDYRLYLVSLPARLMLKIGMSVVLAALSYRYIEGPARALLNRRDRRPLAYTFLVVSLLLCVFLGVAVRKANYVNAELSDVTRGGLVFQGRRNGGVIVLMGDSNGSMYGKSLKEICENQGARFVVISVAGSNPLPSGDRSANKFWLDSLAVVTKERPDVLVLACRWETSLAHDVGRLARTLGALEPHVGRILIVNQPPALPPSATRVAIRQGVRPPFYEDPGLRRLRLAANEIVNRSAGGKVEVIDVASYFQGADGEVRFLDDHGRQLYHDSGHLSGFGAALVKPVLASALFPIKAKDIH